MHAKLKSGTLKKNFMENFLFRAFSNLTISISRNFSIELLKLNRVYYFNDVKLENWRAFIPKLPQIFILALSSSLLVFFFYLCFFACNQSKCSAQPRHSHGKEESRERAPSAPLFTLFARLVSLMEMALKSVSVGIRENWSVNFVDKG